jgi:hypothetical protein
MMRVFEQPHTARLFTSTGGGFFHNHTKGLYQVDQVAETAGILIEQFTRDPNCPTVTEVLLNDPQQRETILQASLATPLYLSRVLPSELQAALPVLREGRFIVEVEGDRGCNAVEELIKQARRISRLP